MRRWLLPSLAVGLATGVVVACIDFLIYRILWIHVSRLASNSMLLCMLMPAAGLCAAGFLISASGEEEVRGAEEVVRSYHTHIPMRGRRSIALHLLSTIPTIGFGGSAGLEGPSICAGGAIGSALPAKVKCIRLKREDRCTMMLAGAAAGIAAIFKAPLTGIVFALEVPFKNDLAHEALIPALVASVPSYMVFAKLAGAEPLFAFRRHELLTVEVLVASALLGAASGLLAVAFVKLYRLVRGLFRGRAPLPAKTLAGGLACGALGALSTLLAGRPYALGSGYELIRASLAGELSTGQLAAMVLLKSATTVFTLGSGALGGVFIPMIAVGAALGGALAELGGGPIDLYAALGMASFLAAGYKTPLAAVAFVAETTGSSSYLIPCLVASSVSYLLSGGFSVSDEQRPHKEVRVAELAKLRVSDYMTTKVVCVPAEATIAEFISKYLLKHRHRSFPVVKEGRLVGMVAVDDVVGVPEEEWRHRTVYEVATREVIVAYPDESLSDVLDVMEKYDIGRVPVVDPRDPGRIMGIISKTDIVKAEAKLAGLSD